MTISFTFKFSSFDFSSCSSVFPTLSCPVVDNTKVNNAIFENDLTISADDVSGYPSKGLLILNSKEVVKYISIDKFKEIINY